MGTRKYDYLSLKAQYVQTDITIRELCRQNGISSWSAVNAVKHREEWDRLRSEFRRQVESRSLEALATKRANKVAQIQVDALEVIHAGILKMAEDMDETEEVLVNDKWVRRKRVVFGPRDLATLIDKFQTLIGQPQTVQENRNLNLGVSAEVGHDDLRTLLAALRPQPALTGPAGEAAAGDPS